MRVIRSAILFITLLFVSFGTSFWLSWDDLIDVDGPDEIPYCNEYDINWNNKCGLTEGTLEIRDKIDDIETERPLSEYVQDVVTFLLWFVSLVAVLYILYAWFNILISWWDEEKVKNSKMTIIYAWLWIILMWIAYSIVLFIIRIIIP